MKINMHQQRGMSGTTLAFIIFILIFVLWIFFKLFPIYVENMKVEDALEKIKEEQNAAQKTAPEIQQFFLAQLSEKDVELFDNKNVKQHLTVRRDKVVVEITVKYERRKPLMGNVFFLVEFENSVEVP
jgi:flagellar biosynthesis protein FliP